VYRTESTESQQITARLRQCWVQLRASSRFAIGYLGAPGTLVCSQLFPLHKFETWKAGPAGRPTFSSGFATSNLGIAIIVLQAREQNCRMIETSLPHNRAGWRHRIYQLIINLQKFDLKCALQLIRLSVHYVYPSFE
jgi:hypothetical protein